MYHDVSPGALYSSRASHGRADSGLFDSLPIGYPGAALRSGMPWILQALHI